MIYDLQKASLWKRVAAFLLDMILLVIIATGVLALLSWVTGFDGYRQTYFDRMQAVEEEYALVQAGILDEKTHLFDMTEQTYSELSESNRALYDQAAQAF